jgi:farnesyl diphosphate synthase
MHMTGITSPSSYSQAQAVLIPLGEYFQVQDDYLDCYGSPEQIGKIGTDILDNKCSWNVNIAIKLATPEQRRILDENYGQKNSESENKVKEVFNQIGVEKLYKDYEAEAYKRINGLIDQIDETVGKEGEVVLKRQIFTAFLEKIYGRTK